MSRLIVYGGTMAALGLFAESAATPVPGEWGNITALAAVIGVLIFIVTRMLPDLHQKSVDQSKAYAESSANQSKIFADTIKETQTQFSSTLDKINEREIDATKTNTEELAKLREHCARTHGIQK